MWAACFRSRRIHSPASGVKPKQQFCEQMLKKKMVHFIASDAHGVKNRPPMLSVARDAAAKIIGAEAADKTGAMQIQKQC